MPNTTFDTLNPQQKEAILHTDGPSLILAGAGSGKTRVLVGKVHHLIQTDKATPAQIVMITFTNKAAKEMKERIGHAYRLGFVGTFHSFCSRVLRIDGETIGISNNYVIFDDADQQSIIKNILKTVNAAQTPGFFLNKISAAKSELITPAQYSQLFHDYLSLKVAEVYMKYEKELKKNNALDFDDLIVKTIQLFRDHPEVLESYHRRYKYILVDEFQDTNTAQYTLTKQIAQGNNNITVVGDFSQSIYSWRGADIRNLEKFEKDFKNTVTYKLDTNYRSTTQILDFAYNIISQNTTHPILHLKTNNNKGSDVVFYEAFDEQDEIFYIINSIGEELQRGDCKSFAILYRTNAQSRVLEEGLLHAGLSYVLIGGTRFYERKEIKDILCYLRLLLNPQDEVSKARILKLGKRKFEKLQKAFPMLRDDLENTSTTTLMEKIFEETGYLDQFNPMETEDFDRLENIKELKSVAYNFPKLPEFLEQVALVESEYSQHEKEVDEKKKISLMTLHQAKGLEFDSVYVVGLEEGLLPHARSMDDQFQLEEERRLFYVGITRARKTLYITSARRRFIFGRSGPAVKSRFISDGLQRDEVDW